MNLLKKSFLKVIIPVFGLIIIFSGLFSIQGNASLPNIITEHPYPIDPVRSSPITVYFHYGVPSYGDNIEDATAKVQIKGGGLQIVKDSVFDLYYDERDNTGRQKIPSCNDSYDGPEYPVPPNLITSTTITHDLQSAKTQGVQPGTLRAHSAGCIRFDVVVKNAEAGQLAEIIFDQDSKLSQSYDESNRPGKQIIKIRFGEGSECSEGQEYILNQCVDKCAKNETRTLEGECEVLKDTCEGDMELINDKCVKKCGENEERNGYGACVTTVDNDTDSGYQKSGTSIVCFTEDCDSDQQVTFEKSLLIIGIFAGIILIFITLLVVVKKFLQR